MTKLTFEMSERLKIDYLLPAIETRRVGSVVTLSMSLVMPDISYRCRKTFLQVCETFSLRELKKTAYWKSRLKIGHDATYIVRRVRSYIKLLKSVTRKGIVVDPANPRTYPIVFVHENVYQRMDGAHRVSVYRFLGHSTVEVWLVTAGEVLAKLDLPSDLKEVLETGIQPCIYSHERVG